MLTYPPRLRLANLPTPLQLLSRLSADMGLNIWMKRDDLTGTATSGNKIRKLEFCLAKAKAENCDTVITCGGIQSNHCRATAALCAKLGLQVHLILRGVSPESPDGNLLLDKIFGASISFVTDEEYRSLDELFERVANQYIQRGNKPFMIPTGASDEIGLWGYIAACPELKRDFEEKEISPDVIFTATGSGGTQAGLILGNYIYELDCDIQSVNVCDDEAYFLNKIGGDLNKWQHCFDSDVPVETLPINIIDGYVGPGYGRADEHVFDTIKRVARQEGILLDPVYTGKAFDAMLTELKSDRFAGVKNVVFIHTGGVYGLFPQRQNFL